MYQGQRETNTKKTKLNSSTCLIISFLFITNVKNSCILVNSTKHGELKIVKEEKNMDAQCLGGIILQKSADESYCIAKNPDPEKLEILTCYGEGIVDCQPNIKLVHMKLGNTSVLCTSLTGAHCIKIVNLKMSHFVFGFTTFK